MPSPLESGLYEQLIDAWLEERLSTASETRAEVQEARLDPAVAADRLALHFGRLLERAINDLPEKERARRGVEVVMAFIRRSGLRPLRQAIASHCGDGKPLRVLTTTFTGSTELRALEELDDHGAEVRVSYDTSGTRLHAKSWRFERRGGVSTAYVGSSNWTHPGQVTGLEWNVRASSARARTATPPCSITFSPPSS